MSKPYTTQVLGASRIYAVGAAGAQVYDAEILRNTFENTMLVEEIRFLALPSGVIAAGVTPGVTSQSLFDKFAVHFKTSMYELMGEPIVIDMLGTNYQTDLEWQAQVRTQAQYLESFRRWILPEPLWLVPGDTLLTRIFSLTGVGALGQNLEIWVFFIGKITDAPVPRTIRVPYVFQYIQQTPIGPASPTELIIPAQALQSTLDRPMRVQRFTARLQTTRTGIPSPNEAKLIGRDILRDVPDFCDIWMYDDQQYQITDWVNLGSFVDPTRCAWTFIRDIAPLAYFKVRFRRNAITGFDHMGILPRLAVIGSREENAR